MPDIVRTQLLFAYTGVITPVLVVATKGGANDWAAYAAGVPAELSRDHEPESPIAQMVAELGFKLDEAQARAFFPTMQGDYRP